jgi:hypothetical protein
LSFGCGNAGIGQPGIQQRNTASDHHTFNNAAGDHAFHSIVQLLAGI